MADDAYHGILNEFYEARGVWDNSHWRMADLSLAYVRSIMPDMELGPGQVEGWKPRLWKPFSGDVGFAPRTLLQFAFTAHTFPDGERMLADEYITFQHHLLCAFTDDPGTWLARAAEESWSTAQLRLAISQVKPKPEHCVHEEKALWCDYFKKRVQPDECEKCLHRAC